MLLKEKVYGWRKTEKDSTGELIKKVTLNDRIFRIIGYG